MLQSRILAFFVKSESGLGLMLAAEERPGDDECRIEGWFEEKPREQSPDFRHRWHERAQERQAAIGLAGLVSFALLHAARRNCALSLARNAPAAITRLM